METNIENILLLMILAVEEGRNSDYMELRVVLFDLLAREYRPLLNLVK